ncbi:hypothetical protein MJ3_11275 [Salimicrobium jeotgali]|uniref:Uncharacterized protein n=1 Tax=Salimicrobium jeotgali TaxID=1230341 RepID=K2G6R0_9BACI|nr:hypothetical protein [Salimicrobium jeotgali]EKE30878.1 hypothetical protein MJ3_11275 [Salimicrobium jeotgali]MBM7697658.1 hypothetical protein [Salimicrobium jeotgali]
MKTKETLYKEVVDSFEPKINKALNNTSSQDREDMEQEIKIRGPWFCRILK